MPEGKPDLDPQLKKKLGKLLKNAEAIYSVPRRVHGDWERLRDSVNKMKQYLAEQEICLEEELPHDTERGSVDRTG